MQPVIIIPARYGSTRFPGKPMAPVAGVSLLERVWRIAVSTGLTTYIATDDARLVAHAESFGARTVMTPEACANGTERAAEAIKVLPTRPDAVINLQGDAVLTPPWVIEAVAQGLASLDADIVTPAVPLDWDAAHKLAAEKNATPGSGTLVVTDQVNKALYFSKNMIPYVRDKNTMPCPYRRHIGLYGYTAAALERYVALPVVALEQAEGLEQLRALYHGQTVAVVDVDYRGRSHGSIDSPEDVARVEDIIAREGELVEG